VRSRPPEFPFIDENGEEAGVLLKPIRG
jgi:hypothetical protein